MNNLISYSMGEDNINDSLASSTATEKYLKEHHNWEPYEDPRIKELNTQVDKLNKQSEDYRKQRNIIALAAGALLIFLLIIRG